jgi:LmbE family N-acetylglucosaminyl deacetylase
VSGSAILSRIEERRSINERVMIVAAHPDDETIGLGAQLCHFEDASIVHLTDGAPRNPSWANANGFATPSEYAAARVGELRRALCVGAAVRSRTHRLGIVDQEAMHHLVSLTHSIRNLLQEEKPEIVITHAYEGGHPDHDAAAFAVHVACRLLDDPPDLVEMTSHFRDGKRRVFGEFLSSDQTVTTIHLNEEELKRKRAMIACFVTQGGVAGLGKFILPFERFRPAPQYDLSRPPHDGELDYETMGFGIARTEWLHHSTVALIELKRGDQN